MKILGIETASNICAVAIVENGCVLNEKSLDQPSIHSQKLISLIDDVLTNTYDFDAIAVSIGPGSFTGLRIGLSVAKGILYGSNKPITAVSTLKAIAYNLLRYKNENSVNGLIVCALIDARRDEFYTAIYEIDNKTLLLKLEPQAIRYHDLVELVSEKKMIFIGNGVEKFLKLIINHNIKKNIWIFKEGLINLCSAGSVALLGEYQLFEHITENIFDIEPVYVKDFHTLVKNQYKI